MSLRRSPRLTGPSPKPELPQKPRPPKRVQNPAEDSVREANYQVELAQWEAEKEEHKKLMKKRQSKQVAAVNAARKAAKMSAETAAPSPAALAPPQHVQLSADELRLVSSPEPERRKPAAARAARVERPPELRRFPRLQRGLVRWILDVEAVAIRCGADEAQRLHRAGEWFDPEDYGGTVSPWP